jgi:translocation and assembly module TamA
MCLGTRGGGWVALAALAMAGAVTAAGAGAERPAFPYEARVSHVRPKALREPLADQSLTIRLQAFPPATPQQLQHRIDGDLPRLMAVLQSNGYYAGTVTDRTETNRTPTRVIFSVTPGPLYRFGRLAVTYEDLLPGETVPPAVGVHMRRGLPAAAPRIMAEERRVLESIMDHGYPFPELAGKDVRIDHEGQVVDVTFRVRPGPHGRFGPVAVSGTESVRERFVRRRVSWHTGDPFRHTDVRNLEQDLLTSGLFASARISFPGELDADGTLPVSVEVMERKHRTVRVGAQYATDIGIGGKLSWEHRNLFHGAESLECTLAANEVEQLMQLFFRRPDFLTPNLALLLNLKSERDSPEAYNSRAYVGSVLVEKQMTRQSKVSTGLALKRSFVEQFESEDDYNLLSIPSVLDWDTRDNQLDATRGFRTVFAVEPFRDLGGDDNFFRWITEGRTYASLSRKENLVLAVRLSFGSLSGTELEGIPADERFYVGGGGSVRGYEYQTVGVLVDGIPVGGKSMLETSLEVRYQPGAMLGYVAFVDGGMAFTDNLPDASIPLQWGAGLGLRYSLGFAPLRLDVAVPLNPRDGVDPAYQFYISVGQSF